MDPAYSHRDLPDCRLEWSEPRDWPRRLETDLPGDQARPSRVTPLEALPKLETPKGLVSVVALVLNAAARRRRLFSCRFFACCCGSGSRGGGGVGSGSDCFEPPPNKHMMRFAHRLRPKERRLKITEVNRLENL